MTVDDLVAIVCACLNEIGITPEGAVAECAACDPQDLGLDRQTTAKLIACIDRKVKARGQTVVIGRTMWRRSRTVRDFCEALAEQLE